MWMFIAATPLVLPYSSWVLYLRKGCARCVTDHRVGFVVMFGRPRVPPILLTFMKTPNLLLSRWTLAWDQSVASRSGSLVQSHCTVLIAPVAESGFYSNRRSECLNDVIVELDYLLSAFNDLERRRLQGSERKQDLMTIKIKALVDKTNSQKQESRGFHVDQKSLKQFLHQSI